MWQMFRRDARSGIGAALMRNVVTRGENGSAPVSIAAFAFRPIVQFFTLQLYTNAK